MAKRTTNIVKYFIIILSIVACLQLCFSLYTIFFSERFIFTTSNSSAFYKLIELKSEEEHENAKAQTLTAATTTPPPTTTTTAPPNADSNAESNGNAFENKTTLLTNRTCTKNYSLLILVSSAPANLQRRNYIRKTWAFERAFKPRWTTVFLIAQTRIQSESNSLLKEDEVYRDLVRASFYDHYWNQTRKIKMGFEWATRYCKFSFLLKTDDDVFVNSVELLSFLNKPTTPKKKLYLGNHYQNPSVHRGGKWKVTKEEYRESHYPNFCPGFGYVLSHDVVTLFVKAFVFVPYFRLDDVYVGMLANRTGIKIIHNAGFELDAPRQCIPDEGTLVRHGFQNQEDCLLEIFNRTTKVIFTGLSK